MLLLLALVLQPQAVGLEAGESFQQLAKTTTVSKGPALMHGRVLDAFTGRPLAGAKIETWSEEINEVFGGYHRLGEARSRRDGRFTIRQQVGSALAEKARISAPGYLTWSGVRGDLHSVVRVFPQMQHSPRLRVLDLEGHPIAGARITSTYTCVHDVPAFDLRTGADGIAELTEYGLQDDVQELRIRAPGYLAIRNLDGEPMFATHDKGGLYDIFLARQRPFRIRMVKDDGGVLSDLPIYVVNDGEGYHVERTNRGGVLSIESRYGSGELGMRVLGGPMPVYIANFSPPGDRVPTLRIMAHEWPKNTKTGTLRVNLLPLTGKQLPEKEGEAAAEEEEEEELNLPQMQLFHEEGWWDYVYHGEDGDDGGTPFPAGKGFLVLGGAFSGYEEEIHDFELEPGKTVMLKPKLALEPSIQVQAPKQGDWTLTIQAGKDSKPEIWFNEDTNRTIPFPVPGHRELILCLRGEGRRVRKTIKAARPGMKIDFEKELAALAPEAPKAAITGREIRFVSAKTGNPLAGKFSIRFGRDCQQTPVVDKIHDRFQLRGPIGNAWLARFQADGHNLIFLRGRLEKDQPALIRKVEALASLEIQAPFEFKILGDGAFDLDALPPGRLGLVLLLDNGRRYGLNLTLTPGAKRKIQIR